MPSKSLTFLFKTLYFFENEFKKPHALSKRPTSMYYLSGNNFEKPRIL
jgi:hypothetical protein